jgi:subfamily B ATP-binding cassette protein MsbA
MIAFLRRIWTFVKPYQSRLIIGFLAGIFYAGISAALVLSINLVIDLVFKHSDPVSLVQRVEKTSPFLAHLLEKIPQIKSPSSRIGMVCVISTVPLIMFLRGLFSYLNVYLMSWSSLRAVTDLRSRVFAHVQDLPLQFFSKVKTGDLISRLSNDTWILNSIISSSFASIIKDPVTVLALLSMLIIREPRLTLISMLVFPVCLVPIVIYGRKVRRSYRSAQAHNSELTTVMHEAFTGNRVIKAYNLERHVYLQFRDTSQRIVSQLMRTLRSTEIPSQLMEFLGAVGVTLVFLYVLFFDPTMTPGNLMAFVTAFFLMYQPIKSLSRLNSQLQQAQASCDRIFELLDTPSSILDPPNPKPLLAAGAPIRFQGVDFAYGEKPVLRDIHLTVKPGELVAVVGSSGAGKTTLTNLLLRFYDPQRGAILIGDTDIRQVAIKDLRNQIALVAQETILFNETIRRNIELGRPGASPAEIEAAARHAYAHDFIIEKPQGYDTVVGEKGIAVSGGQRQRISIARALLKNAPILVLDEATSSLDTESERAVQAALEELMVGRTTICIAHRLSTIQKADRIIVLDQGGIVEQGTHLELVKNGGVYQKLYELQFQA